MLPRSTHTRSDREAARGRQTGRTQEIQRLIGRSLRAVVDTSRLGERTLKIDCDVIQADGGTRTASVTGAFVALHDAVGTLLARGLLATSPISDFVAAVSVGIYEGVPVLDLDYAEDSSCDTDMNVVMTGSGGFVELQGTAEGKPFSTADMDALVAQAKRGIGELIARQKAALGLEGIGVCVRALGGEPGVHSARFAGEPRSDERNNLKLVQLLSGEADRRAHYTCMIVLMRHADDPEPVIAEGIWQGEIVLEPRGANGFGYDPHFHLPDLGKTAAELEAEQKNLISHRGKALRRLLAKL